MLTSTESLARTRIRVGTGVDGARARVRSTVGLGDPAASSIRPVIVRRDRDGARVSLVPDGALLLADDAIELDVAVDPGACLRLVEPAGTVAFDMRGRSARWDVRISVGAGATLLWAGQPFVVSAGARVRRRTRIDLARGSRLAIRETFVLGRHGERPGSLHQQTEVSAEGPVLVEDLVLDAGTTPALLGGRRVMTSVLSYGARVPPPDGPDADRYELDGGALLWRRLGHEAHEASLDHAWRWAGR